MVVNRRCQAKGVQPPVPLAPTLPPAAPPGRKSLNVPVPTPRPSPRRQRARGPDSGLDINDPEDKTTLKALPGKFSGLHLLAIMYTAFRQIDPTMDTGADFSAEYQAALEMQKS